MVSLPGGTSAPPGVRRPTFTIAFAAGGGGGGALGGLASVASSLGLTGGARDPWKESLVTLSVESGLAPRLDLLEIVLSGNSQAPAVAVGDTGTVKLGYADGEEVTVFTGKVDRVRRRLDGSVILNASNAAQLAHLRVNQSFEQQKAGDIVNDLIGRTGISAGTVENGADFAFYAVDDRCSAYAVIADLARRSGLIAFIDHEGKLSFTA